VLVRADPYRCSDVQAELPNHPRWRHVAAACLGEPFAGAEATGNGGSGEGANPQEGPASEGGDNYGSTGKGMPSVQYFNKVPGHSLPTPPHQDNFVRVLIRLGRTKNPLATAGSY